MLGKIFYLIKFFLFMDKYYASEINYLYKRLDDLLVYSQSKIKIVVCVKAKTNIGSPSAIAVGKSKTPVKIRTINTNTPISLVLCH